RDRADVGLRKEILVGGLEIHDQDDSDYNNARLASPQEGTSQVRQESSRASRLFRLCLLSGGAWKNIFGHSIYSFMMLRCFLAMARRCFRYKQLDNKSVEALLADAPTVHRVEQSGSFPLELNLLR